MIDEGIGLCKQQVQLGCVYLVLVHYLVQSEDVGVTLEVLLVREDLVTEEASNEVPLSVS